VSAQGSIAAGPPTHEIHGHALPRFADPGKEDRSAHGIPVVPEFDGYRAFAIFAILGTHLILAAAVVGGIDGDWGDQLMAAFGPWLISILFIVSGFVVFLPTVARGGEFGSVGGYAIRRAARLLPAFWMAMLIVLILIATEPSLSFPGPDKIIVTFAGQDTWASFFDPSFPDGFGIDAPVWTLTLEIGFYIVLPLIASAYCRRPLLGLALAAAISIGWRVGFENVGSLAGLVGMDVSAERAGQLNFAALNQLPSWAFAFGAGMTGAWAFVNLPRRYGAEAVARVARPALLAAIAAIAICAYFSHRYALESDPIAAALRAQREIPLFLGYIGAIAAAMLALSLSQLRSPFCAPFARRLGDLSYGVFLIHAPIIWAFLVWTGTTEDGSPGALITLVAVVVPLSVAYGYLSARLVEQPIRRWARRFGRRAEEPADGAPESRRSPGPPVARKPSAAEGDA
jgi:acetyltransferase